ncbi:MAG: ribosome recycling factor [Prevotellaceae bacterium]|jgi:ribosome recycling factor|nr:ribosome recycling factor [Prevotellaceae bacterium]
MDISIANEQIAAGQARMEKSIEHLEAQLLVLRAGKANVHVLDSITVDYYGAPTPLAQVASVTVPDARTILVQPWEKKLLPVIEKAILVANIGFTPQNNGEQIRINVPPLTEERRKDLVKQVKNEGEQARMSLRSARHETIEAIRKLKKDGLSEDLAKDAEAEMQKIIDSYVKKVDEALSRKEAEIMKV